MGQRNRLDRLESQLVSAANGTKFVGTLENLCKLLWRQDRKWCVEMVAGGDPTLRVFTEQFEREDAACAARVMETGL